MFRNIIIILLIMFFVYIFLNKITTEGFSNKKRKNCPSDNPECTSNIGDTGISPLSPEMLEQARRDAEDLRKRQKTAASDAKKRKEQEVIRKAAEKRRIADSADKSFIEDIMHKTPRKELAPSIQDGVLLLFWFGWLTMMVTLVVIRWFSPGGTWKAGMFTLLLLTILTVCVYGLLLRIA
jgi:hypothetical protein